MYISRIYIPSDRPFKDIAMSKSCLVYNFSSEVAKEIAQKTGSQISDKLVDALTQQAMDNGMLTHDDIHGNVDVEKIASRIIVEASSSIELYAGQKSAQEFKNSRPKEHTVIPLFAKKDDSPFLLFRTGVATKNLAAFDSAWRSILQTFGPEFARLHKTLEDLQATEVYGKTEKADDAHSTPLLISQGESPIVETQPAQIAPNAVENTTSDNTNSQNNNHGQSDASATNASVHTYGELFERHLGKDASDSLPFVKKMDDPKSSRKTIKELLGEIPKKSRESIIFNKIQTFEGRIVDDDTKLAYALNKLLVSHKTSASNANSLYDSIKAKAAIENAPTDVVENVASPSTVPSTETEAETVTDADTSPAAATPTVEKQTEAVMSSTVANEDAVVKEELAKSREVRKVESETHEFKAPVVQEDELVQLFGDYSIMDEFGDYLTSLFVRQCEEVVIPRKIREYRQKIDDIKKKLNALPASKVSTAAKLRSDILRYNEWVSKLQNEGWLSAKSIPDVMSGTLKNIRAFLSVARKARIAYDSIKKNERTSKDAIWETVAEQMGIGLDRLRNAHIPELITTDSKIDFLSALLPTNVSTTDETLKRRDKLSEQMRVTLEHETEEEKKARQQSDADIMEQRKKAGRLIDSAFDIMLSKLSDRTNTRLSIEQTNDKDEQDEDEQEDDGIETDGETEFRDDIMLNVHERNLHETVSNLVKRFLATVVEYEKVHKDGKTFFVVKRNRFGAEMFVSHIQLYNMLQAAFSKPNAIRTSDDIIAYFKKYETVRPVFHGILEQLKRHPEMKSHLFNAFNKRRTTFRVMKNKNLVSVKSQKEKHENDDSVVISGSESGDGRAAFFGVASNASEDATSVTNKIQVTVSHGIVLEKGTSIYDKKGNIVKANVEEFNRMFFRGKDVEIKDKYGNRKQHISGLLENLNLNKADEEKFILSNANQVRTVWRALRSVGVVCSYDDMRFALLQRPGNVMEVLRIVKSILNVLADDNPMSSGYIADGAPAYDSLKSMYKELGEVLVGLSENESENVTSVLGSQKQIYTNRNYLGDMVAALSNPEDVEWWDYVENEFLHSADGSSYFYDKVLDEIMCGWIEAMAPQSKSVHLGGNDKYRTNAARRLRELFLNGCDQNDGIEDDSESGLSLQTKYKDLSPAQRIKVDMYNFYFPTRGEFLKIGEATDAYGVRRRLAKYAFPLLADSENHIFITHYRYTDKDKKSDKGYQTLSSRDEGSLLWNLSKVVLSDFNRIVALQNSTQNFGVASRNSDKFTFPELNDVTVTLNDGRKMSVVEFFQDAAKDDTVMQGSIKLSYGNAVTTRTDIGSMDYHDAVRSVVMDALETFVLPEYLRRDMDAWESFGVFGEHGAEAYLPQVPNELVSKCMNEQSMRKKLYQGIEMFVCGSGMMFAKTSDGKDVTIAASTTGNSQKGAEMAWVEFWRSLTPKARLFIFGLKDRHFMENYMMLPTERREKALESVAASVGNEIYEALVKFGLSQTPLGDNIAKMFTPNQNKEFPGLKNSLLLAMREYEWNYVYARTQMVMLTHGDATQFKNLTDFAKRNKAGIGAYEHPDIAAEDKYHDNRKVIEWYGDRRKADVIPGWDISKQRAIYIADREASIGKDDKTSGASNLSQYWNEQLQPKLKRELEAADKYRSEQAELLKRGEITKDEHDRRIAGLLTRQDYADACQGFGGMCTSDGQSFRTIESMRTLMIMLGQWSDDLEELYESVMRGEKLSMGEVREAIQQLKTFCFGHEDVQVSDGRGGTYTVRMSQFIKDSEACLFMYTDKFRQVMGEDSWLVGVLDAARENLVDTIHFSSAVKLGGFNIIDLNAANNAADARQIVNDAIKSSGDGPANVVHAVSYDSLGKQVPTPPHLVDVRTAIGIQVNKLIGADIPPTTKYVDSATGEIKEKPTSIKVRNPDGSIRYTLTYEQYKDLYRRVQVTKARKKLIKLERRLEDKNELSKLLLDRIGDSDKYPDNLKWAVTINPTTGDFNLPLDDPTVFDAVQMILGSVIRKNIVKQKTRGGTATQLTSIGLSNALRVVTRKDEETGMEYALYAEALLPAWSKSFFKAYADESGQIDIEKVPERLREMIGYRVPTEHIYSTIPIRVVGFLDEEGGTSVMLPQEIVVWSGSDFDIDKLYLEMMDFEEVEDRDEMRDSPKELWDMYYEANPQVREQLDKRWEELFFSYVESQEDADYAMKLRKAYENPATRGRVMAEFRKKHGEARGLKRVRLFDVVDDEEMRGLQKSFTDFLDSRGLLGKIRLREYDFRLGDKIRKYDSSDKSTSLGDFIQEQLDTASESELSNLFIELQRGRLCSDFSFNDLNRPGGFTTQKKMERVMTIMKSISVDDYALLTEELGSSDFEDMLSKMSAMDENALSKIAGRYARPMSIFQASVDAQLFYRNVVGHKMIGICALHNALHSVLQDSPLTISAEAKANLPFIINGKTLDTIGNIYDEDGNSILRNIAGYLAASVDNAKDPVLEGLNANPVTADTMMAMLHLGYSVKTVSLFFSQPAVKEIVRLCERNGSRLSKECEEFVKQDYHAQTGLTHEIMMSELLNNRASDISEILKSPAQYDVINALASIAAIGETLSEVMKATKLDSAKNSVGNNYGDTYERSSHVKALSVSNKKSVGKGKEKVEFNVFSNDLNFIVTDLFDIGGSTPKTVSEYMNGSAQPTIQSLYDFCFKRPLRIIGKHIKSYSPEVLEIVEMLNSMSASRDRYSLKSKVVNDLMRDLKTFVITATLSSGEWNPNGLSLSKVREMWLNNFPKKYSEVLRKCAINKRNLQKEFDILRHIVKKNDALQFANGGEVSKYNQNSVVASWKKLANDKDPDVRKLATQLFIYSVFYNGCAFSPTAFGHYCPYEIRAQIFGYADDLGNMDKMPIGQKKRFLDQFVRNHYAQMPQVCKQISLIEHKKFYDLCKGDDGKLMNKFVIDAKSLGFLMSRGRPYAYVCEPMGNVLYRIEPVDNGGGTYEMTRCTPLGGRQKREYDATSDLTMEDLQTTDSAAVTQIPQMDITESRAVQQSVAQSQTSAPIIESTRQPLKQTVTPQEESSAIPPRESLNMVTEDELETKKANDYADMVVETLTKDQVSISREGDDEGLGNSSKAYIVNEQGDRAMRVHTFLPKMDIKFNIPDVTDADMEVWRDDGARIGQLFDTFTRLFFEKHFDPEHFTKEKQEQMDKLFPPSGEPGEFFNSYYFFYKWEKGSLSLRGELDTQLGAIVEEMKAAGDVVYASLGDKSLVVWADCMTKDGIVKIGGEMDLLVRHADGSFSIYDMKAMRPAKYRDMFEKGEASQSYQQYQNQLNAYRSILQTRFPNIKIRGMKLMCFVIERELSVDGSTVMYVNPSNGKSYPRRGRHAITTKDNVPIRFDDGHFHPYPDESLVFSNLEINNGDLSGGFVNIVPKNVGITVPSRTVGQEAAESEIKAVARQINTAAANGDASTYTALFERYLGKENTNELKFVARLDNPKMRERVLSMQFSKISDEAKDSKKYKKMEAAGFTLTDDSTMAMTLNSLVFDGKADGSAVKELYKAVKLKRNVRDDAGNIIC